MSTLLCCSSSSVDVGLSKYTPAFPIFLYIEGYVFHRTLCSALAPTTYSLDQAMAPIISYHEIHHISYNPQSARSLLLTPLPAERQSHRSIFRHISLSHKRRFRYRQYPDNSPPIVPVSEADNPPSPYKPTPDPRTSAFSSTSALAISTVASDPTLSESALLQLQVARSRATATTAALIAVCVVLGLAVCTMMGRLAYRRRSSLFRCLRPHRQAEDNLGFVFIQYDDSTWGMPPKGVPGELPSFETGTQKTEGGEGHARPATPDKLTPKVDVNHIPVISPPVVETLPGTNRSQYPLPLKRAESGSCRELIAVVGTDGQVPSDATHEESETLNALGLAIGCDDSVDFSTLASPQLAAALARRASEADEAIEETEFTVTSSPGSDSAACGLSIKSSGTEEDYYELQRVETRSVDFERGIVLSLEILPDMDYDEDKIPPLDLYSLPRVVISASSSVASEVLSSRTGRASGRDGTTIDLGDFPRPPFISDTLTSTSTSLISEIEDSLGPVIGRNLGMTGRRASSAPQLMC